METEEAETCLVRYVLLALGLTALAAVALSRALTKGIAQLEDDVVRVFGAGRTRFGGTEARESESPQARYLRIDSTSTPDSWWQGGTTVSYALATSATLRPVSFELYSATDHNSDGHVAAFEWTLLRTEPISVSSGEAVASIPPTHIESDAAAYRVVVRFYDGQPTGQARCRPDLTYDDF